MVAIIANTVCMAMTHFGQTDELTDILRSLSIVFLVLFAVEAALKLKAFGRTYFRDHWCEAPKGAARAAWVAFANVRVLCTGISLISPS